MKTVTDFPNLNRDLGVILGGLLASAVLIGAGIGVAVSVAIHRHKAA